MGSTGEITILGCGGSGGTPLICGHWATCDPNEPKNTRTRPSIMIRTPQTSVIIDTGADFRAQTLRENITHIDAVVYSHSHADHIHGIDDVRYASIKRRINGEDDFIMPIYGTNNTLSYLKKTFEYMFKVSDDGLYIPLVQPHEIEESGTLTIGDITIQHFGQIHGAGRSLGFRIGNVAYSTDVSGLEKDAFEKLKGIDTWIVDCGQFGANDEDLTVHPNIGTVLRWNETVGAKHIYLTHLTPRCDYQEINDATPDYVECAYDGLKIKVNVK